MLVGTSAAQQDSHAAGIADDHGTNFQKQQADGVWCCVCERGVLQGKLACLRTGRKPNRKVTAGTGCSTSGGWKHDERTGRAADP